jgi:Carboxypeptidase regulatory-like domain
LTSAVLEGQVVTFDANRKKEILFVTAFLVLVFCLQVSTPLNAQVAGQTLSGRITSTGGTSVANARITLKNPTNGDTKSIAATEDGSFAFANLAPGIFEITVSAPGFAEARTSVTISSGVDSRADIVMNQHADAGEGGASGVSGVVSTKSVTDLPLNGRSASDLAALEPGVASARTQATGQAQRGFGNQMTISGGRPRQNDARLDGISVNDYVNGPPGSALGVSLGSDGVEQFSVLTSNYPAQVGRSSGGVIAASTRSGTKDFHGSAFEYIRNSAFDARNFFDTAKPAFHRNQFGGSIGGPIFKDRTFFFADYEGLRQSQGITQVDTVPSQAVRDGHLCAPPDCSSTTPIVVDAQVARFLKAFYPLPNGALLCPFSSCAAGTGDTGIFTFAGQTVTPENYFTTKIDHTFSTQDSLAGTYMFDSGTVRQPDEFDNKRTGYDSRKQVFTLHETHTVSPQLLNSFHFGINRVVTTSGLTFPSGNSLVGDPTFGTVPGLNAAAVMVPGLTFFTGGLRTPSNFRFHWTSIQASDDLSLTNGAHSVKLGVNVERMRDNILAISNPGGEFAFSQLSNFLTNQPFSLSAAIPGAVSERGIRQTVFGAYVQDDWRWRSNVTLNLGLRYEMATVPTEVQGKTTVLRNLTDPLPVCGVFVPGSCSGTGSLFSNPTLRNFEPRVGFSWDPFRDGKTSLSGGFGMFDVLPLPYLIQFNEIFSAPFFELGNSTSLPAGSFPTGAFGIVAGSTSGFRQGFFDPHPERNYVMQWNLTLARDLTRDVSLRVGYVGSRGVHQMFRVEDGDIVLPSLTSQGYLWPSPVGSGTRMNPNAGLINEGLWQGNSFYDALQVKVKAKIGSGAEIGGSYTWGKTIDTSSGSLVGDEYSNSIASPLGFNTKINRGLADFNVAHNVEVNYTWEIGTPKWAHGVSGWALSGWEISGVFEASTGVPFTPGFGGDALGVKSTDPNIDVPNFLSDPGCSSPVNPGNPTHYIKTQCFGAPSAPTPAFYTANCDPHFAFPFCLNLRGNLGRNTVIGPGLVNFDFSLFKNNHIKKISDVFNVQFRAEFFNVVNHTNFSPPLDNRNIFDSSGSPIGNAGLITSTQTPSREIQFAIKVIW